MKLTIDFDVSEQDEEVIREGLNEFNAQFVGPTNNQQFRLAVRSEGGEVVGGVLASCMWQWLYINVIWVSESLRGQGHGAELLEAAEQEGINRGMKYVMLHTFSFQARPFYESQGYAVSGEVQDFPDGYSQYVMCKRLGTNGSQDF
jgi:GNAT superfamily N-acetyltransferase